MSSSYVAYLSWDVKTYICRSALYQCWFKTNCLNVCGSADRPDTLKFLDSNKMRNMKGGALLQLPRIILYVRCNVINDFHKLQSLPLAAWFVEEHLVNLLGVLERLQLYNIYVFQFVPRSPEIMTSPLQANTCIFTTRNECQTAHTYRSAESSLGNKLILIFL